MTFKSQYRNLLNKAIFIRFLIMIVYLAINNWKNLYEVRKVTSKKLRKQIDTTYVDVKDRAVAELPFLTIMLSLF